METHFKAFLLNEENQYFGAKVGDVLAAVQELSQDAQNMNSRHLTRLVTQVVNQIRAILRSRWSIRQRPRLERLQRDGVALLKSLDGELDIVPTLASVSYDLASLMGDLKTPINQTGTGLAENMILG